MILEVFLCVLGHISVFGYIWYPESGIWFPESGGIQNPESGGLAVSGFQNPESGGIWFLAVLKYGQKKKGSHIRLPFFFCLGECRYKCKYLCWVYLSISLFDKDDSVDLGQNETLFVFLVYAHLSLGA